MRATKRALALAALALVGGLALAHAQPSQDSSAASLIELEKRLDTLVQTEQKLRAELDAIEPKERELRKRMVVRGRILYRLTRAGLLPVGQGFDALVEHAAKVEKMRRAVEQDAAELKRLAQRREAITRELGELAKLRGPLELEKGTLAKARAALEEADERQRAFERAFQKSSGPSDYVAVYGADPDTAVTAPIPAEGFRAMRGRLPFPLRGRTEIREARRPGTSGPGLEMRAPTGTPVYTIHPGRVSFADSFEPYGRVVILDHGDHYYTLLGNLDSIDVRVGDELGLGARVGTVGSDGKGGVLYVEIRRNTDTLDPRPWFGL